VEKKLSIIFFCPDPGKGKPKGQPRKILGIETGKDSSTVLMIRLARFGARKQPYYRVVVIEKDRARNGRFIEVVGHYNPRSKPATVEFERERIAYWTSKGAQLSARVEKLLALHSQAAAA
jgi:small subunit ribosomal protein S16